MSAVAAAAVVISALAGVTTSFDRLISSPEHYGITWHAAAGNFASSEADHEGAARLAANPDIEAFAGVNHHEYLIGEDGATALVLGMDLSQRQGRLEPVITRGRSPRGADEVAVGAVTMRRLGIALGDTIRVRVTGAGKPLHVVGQVVLNDASLGFLQPGKGVLVDAAAAAALDPNQADDPASQAFVIRFTREVNRGAAIARLRGDFPQTVVSPFPASDINNLQRISTLPAALAVLVALLGAGAIAHAIAVTVHRRRRDLAVLRCLGFRTRDISVTVACQASAMGIAGLVVGIPLGAAVGRVIWRLLADQVGVAAAPVTPLVLILSICAAALVAVNVAAAVPAVAARRLRAADILRSPG
ncbi:MAG: ABC transporter permease [Acidimicrobiales bacterium]